MRIEWVGASICFQVMLQILLLRYSYCDNVTCLDPGVSRVGKREGECCSAGDVLRFSCFEDYELVGHERIECHPDGRWSSHRPLCRPLKDQHCDFPPAVPHGMVTGDKYGDFFLPNDVAEIICRPGYKYNASTYFVMCKEGGIWESEFGECTVQQIQTCHDPGSSKVGKREGNCCSVGDELYFSCSEGYELVGLERIMCFSNGTWSSKRPLCKPLDDHCDFPPAVPHRIVIGDKYGDYFLPNDEAEIICEPGYKNNGSTHFVMCEEGGIWEEDFGECAEITCDRPAELADGVIPELLDTDRIQYPYKFQITYGCNEGYRLLGGDSWRFCGEHGWSGETPYCEEIFCPDPGIPENGDRVLDSLRIGAKVRFSCFSGYSLLGSVERYCMPNGQWTGELARCDTPSNYCPNPGTPINGFKTSVHYDYGSTVGFRCHSGYIQVGSEVRECLHNRTWSGTETKCLSPYDFDNNAQVVQVLREGLDTMLENKKKKQKFHWYPENEEDGDFFIIDPCTKKLLDEERRKKKQSFKGAAPVSHDVEHHSDEMTDPCRFRHTQNDRLILHFAFDVSGSVGELNFRRSIDFAKGIVRKVAYSSVEYRVGAVTFSSEAQTVFLPMDFTTTEEVLAHLEKMNYTGGGTSASSALSLIRENIGLEENVAYFRKNNKKDVVIIITDGKTNMGGSPELEANALKQLGVDIYCIGITGNPRIETLYKMASTTKFGNEERPNVFILQNYTAMSSLVQEITFGTVDYSQCGLGMENSVLENKGKVSHGKQKTGTWPWMAAIYFTTEMNEYLSRFRRYKLKCGGTIVHKSFILTAAHCLHEPEENSIEIKLRDKETILVKVGLTNTGDETMAHEFGVKDIHIHEKYKPGNIMEQLFDYDIALIQLSWPIFFNPSVRPICLPPRELPENSSLCRPNEYGWITGWGHIGVVSPSNIMRAQYTISKDLQELYVPIQSDDRCVKSMERNVIDRKYFTDRMFCAGDGKVGNDACKGDSGSPLMQPQMNSEGYLYWTQVGIVSWGIGCGMENTYGFYTHVQRLVSWIEEKINDFASTKFSDEQK